MTLLPYPQQGDPIPGPFGPILQPARNLLCETWRDHPGWIVAPGTPATPLLVPLMDRACPPGSPRPEPPTLPFPGGQCPAYYWVTYRAKYLRNPGEGFDETIEFQSPFLGPISGIKSVDSPVAGTPYITRRDSILFDGGRQERSVQQYTIAGGFEGSTSIVSVRRTDGQPDRCGDLMPVYPTTPEPQAPDIEIVTNINIGGVNVSVPIAIVPLIFSPTLAFSPQILVTVGPIALHFGIDGIDVSLPASPRNPPRLPAGRDPRTIPPLPRFPSPPQAPDTSLPPTAAPPIAAEPCDLTPILDYLNDVIQPELIELLDCDRCDVEPGDSSWTQNIIYTGQSGNLIIPAKCKFIRLELVTIPTTKKSQAGGEADNVIYAGWHTLVQWNGHYPRQPIHYQFNVLEVPPGCEYYSFTLYNGYIGRITSIARIEE